jgi:superfamily I DNA and/or RNA helicase
MMSPLSVAQYLKPGAIQFDTVIFDEASQIMPQDAISSLIRADQAIIAGDTKQLPPTSFFQSDVETTEDVREDLDSILEETASVLPEKDLRWHYRSRTKELIEFSNHHYYNNSLRTFPENEPDVETGVSFEYVSDGVYDRGDSRQNEIEAQRLIDLVEDHAEHVGPHLLEPLQALGGPAAVRLVCSDHQEHTLHAAADHRCVGDHQRRPLAHRYGRLLSSDL